MAKRNLESIIKCIDNLPTMPQVLTALLGILDDPKSSATDINEIMSRDPVLVARILKVVNSAFYALPNRVSSISQAIVILGFNTVKSLAISTTMIDIFSNRDERFSYEKFWSHSVGCGTIAMLLSKKHPGINADTAFVAGLMHDIGKLVLDQYVPDDFKGILEIAERQQVSFQEAEQAVLETTHADLGFWLAKKWRLADDLCEAIHHHHTVQDTADPASRKLAAICSLANYICILKNYGAAGSCGKPTLPIDAWQELAMKKDVLPQIIKDIESEMNRADAFLSVLRK
ncbi:MAG: HDOD domain-containing protein [Planctomycetes bacterium]|nr:HDOD domain-containing protein [Planctomycetota bacterium]